MLFERDPQQSEILGERANFVGIGNQPAGHQQSQGFIEAANPQLGEHCLVISFERPCLLDVSSRIGALVFHAPKNKVEIAGLLNGRRHARERQCPTRRIETCIQARCRSRYDVLAESNAAAINFDTPIFCAIPLMSFK